MKPSTLLLLAAAASAGALVSVPAHSQSREGAIEEIIVTGSYIRRSTFDSSSPIDFIGQEDFAKAGAITVKDIVQNLTYNIGSESIPDTLRSGATTGTESINLRGLGLNSTLVLVNGRRQAEAPNLNNDGIAFVDTASIVPPIAIERMEVLKDGASALYGSDAISGVANFITRNRFEGVEVSYDYQTITNFDLDRPEDKVVQGIVGFGDDRGHVVMAASWLDRNRMPFHERNFATGTGLSGFGSPGTFFVLQDSGESDAAFAARQQAFTLSTFDGTTPRGADLDCINVPQASGRTPINFLFGANVPGTSFPAGAETCVVDFLPTQSLIDAESRVQLWAHFEYLLNIEHNIEAYGEFQVASNKIERANSPSFGFVSGAPVPVTNPGLRNDAFRRGLGGEELIDDGAAQALGFANAIDAAMNNALLGTTVFNGRPLSGVPEVVARKRGRFDPTGEANRDKTHFVAGVKGDFPFIRDNWTFDVASTWSEHKFDGFVSFDTNDSNMKLALDGFGGRDCNPSVEARGTGNCLFFNPFGSAFLTDADDTGPNGLYNTDALFDHIFDPILNSDRQELFVLDAVFTGDLLALPAGNLGMAFGAQKRRQEFSSQPSGTGANFNFSFVVGQEPFEVKRDVWAIFTEFLVPITNADSAIGDLELSLAVRHEDYGGGTGSTTDPKFAFLWRPSNELAVRGTFQTSFKAPGLAQLGGSSTSLNNISTDPFDPDASRSFVPGIAIGNPNLSPEEADVFNIGLTWQPSNDLLDGLQVDLDFWSFDFSNAIRKESNAAVVAAFVAEANAGIVNGPAAQKLTLNSDGTIAVIRSEFVNAASVDTNGIDLSLRYPVELGQFGLLGLSWNSTHILKYEFQETPTGPKITGLNKRNFQTIGAPAPRWRANLGADWLHGNHSANLTLRYTHRYRLGQAPSVAIAAINNRTPTDRIDEHFTVDAQYSYQAPEILGLPGPVLSLGLINAFDEDPPTIDDGPGFDSKIHDPRGRIAYGRITVSF
ncbi:MAG: TonB-dependent receptor domain-containing protein [Pseudomonadales bacterium]